MSEKERYLRKRVKDLEEKLAKAQGGVVETMSVVDALMVQVAKEYGVVEAGGYTVRLQAFDVEALLREWDVHVTKDGQIYEIRVTQKEA